MSYPVDEKIPAGWIKIEASDGPAFIPVGRIDYVRARMIDKKIIGSVICFAGGNLGTMESVPSVMDKIRAVEPWPVVYKPGNLMGERPEWEPDPDATVQDNTLYTETLRRSPEDRA